MQRFSAYHFGKKTVTLRNFATWRAIRWPSSLMHNFWRAPPPLNLVVQKTSKIGAILNDFSILTANILDTGTDIKNRNQIWSTAINGGVQPKIFDF